MQKMSCLFFPDTRIPVRDIVKLLSLFGNVTHYLPCEPDNDGHTGDDGYHTRLSAEKLLHAYPPAPLGEELDRFNQILKEFTSAQYGASATSAQAIAAITASSRPDSDLTSDQLISSIVGRPPEYTEAEQKEREELWSARLYLSLAEKLDEQEKELQEGLRKVSGNETTLFKSLRGEENDMETVLQKAATPLNIETLHTAPSPALLRSRMKAWGRLFLADKQKTGRILITSRQECVAAIIDTCRIPEEMTQLSLLLPEINIEDNSWFEKLAAVREALARPAAEITETLLRNNNQSSMAEKQKMTTDWETSLKQLNQPEISGWSFLNLFCFPQSTAEILSRAFKISAPAPSADKDTNSCIIGLLSAGPIRTDTNM
jgi:hypothetical protein